MDPFSNLLSLLRPQAVDSKLIETDATYPSVHNVGFGLVLEGGCRLEITSIGALELSTNGFLLMPPNEGFAMVVEPGFRMLGGYFEFDASQTDMVRSLLPQPLLIPRAEKLTGLIHMIRREATQQGPGRELILQKLVEVLLVEALRTADLGMLRGLTDPGLGAALQAIHQQPSHPWTNAKLADRANQSRSAFCQNFSRTVGLPPKEYLIFWRMALAKNLLAQGKPLKNVAEAIGYQSASAFSTAFRRQFGHPPGAKLRTAKSSQ